MNTLPSATNGQDRSRFLRAVLWVDASGSAVFLLLLAVGAGPVGRFAGVPFGVPLGIGVTLLVAWVVPVVALVRRIPPAGVGDSGAGVAAVVVGNLVGAIAVAVVLIGFPDALLTRAEWVLGPVGFGMLDLAVLEWIGMRRAG